MTTNAVPTVTTVQKWGGTARLGFNPSAVVHVGKVSRFAGSVVSACNGRTMPGWAEEAPASEVTCKRCVKLVTL